MKSILVIDTPDCCINCDFLAFIKDYGNLELKPYCSRSEIYLKKKDIYRKINKYCPLKHLPQRKNSIVVADGDGVRFEELTEFEQGYNSCIDEILKGE